MDKTIMVTLKDVSQNQVESICTAIKEQNETAKIAVDKNIVHVETSERMANNIISLFQEKIVTRYDVVQSIKKEIEDYLGKSQRLIQIPDTSFR